MSETEFSKDKDANWERKEFESGLTAKDVKVGDIIKFETVYTYRKKWLRDIYSHQKEDWFSNYLNKEGLKEDSSNSKFYTSTVTYFAEVLSVEDNGVTYTKSGKGKIAPSNGHIKFLNWNQIKEVIK